jgi:periplasmic divalent cation tolerance protein
MAAGARATAIVFVMAGSADEATRIARSLVNEELASCVNILVPLRSIYRWRGNVEDAHEHLIIIKTRRNLYSMIERRVRELHSYEVPEILAVTPSAGLQSYLDWIDSSTQSSGGSRRRAARPL